MFSTACLPASAAEKRTLGDRLALFPLQDNDWKADLKDLAPELQADIQEVAIPGPHGNILDGLLMKKPGAKYIYMISHGNGGNMGDQLHFASNILATGQSAFLYDYEGYGDSRGIAKLANLVPDGCSAFDYLTNQAGYKAEQVILYGESIGTGPTAAIMHQRKPRAVILQSGFTSLLTAGREKLLIVKMWPKWLIREPVFDNLAEVKQAHPPLMFIHGDSDKVLSVNYSRTMFAEAAEPKRYYEVKGAGHNNITSVASEGFRSALINFVDSFEVEKTAINTTEISRN